MLLKNLFRSEYKDTNCSLIENEIYPRLGEFPDLRLHPRGEG